MLKSSILFIALLCLSSVVLAARKKGKARKTSTFSTQAFDSCKIQIPTLEDCSSFKAYDSEANYRRGDIVDYSNSIYQFVDNLSTKGPSEDKVCKQFQDCQIKDISWMLVAECAHKVSSDSNDSSGSSSSSDELDI